MLTVDDYELIRRMHVLEGRGIREIRRRLGHSRHTIAKVLSHPTPPGYRMAQPRAKRVLEPYPSIIDAWLEQDQTAPRKRGTRVKRSTNDCARSTSTVAA